MINGLITEICQIRIPVKIQLVFCWDLGVFGSGICNDPYRSKCVNDCGESFGCNNCKCTPGNCGSKQARFDIELGWKCLFGGLICKNCKTLCPGQGPDLGPYQLADSNAFRCCGHFGDGWASPDCSTLIGGASCFNGAHEKCGDNTIIYQSVTSNPPSSNCCPWCCIKIPLIKLSCDEEGINDAVALLVSPFGTTDCNRRYALPGGCITCGGVSDTSNKGLGGLFNGTCCSFLKNVKI